MTAAVEPMAQTSTSPSPNDRRYVLFSLRRLLARRRRFEELDLCASGSPCAWHRRALDRAIVSQLLLTDELGLRRQAGWLLLAHRFGAKAHVPTSSATRR